MRGTTTLYRITLGALSSLLLFPPTPAFAAVWIGKPTDAAACCAQPHSSAKALQLFSGAYPAGTPLAEAGLAETAAYVVGPSGDIRDARIDGSAIYLHTPLKGQHWAFYLRRELQGDTLHVTTAKYRFYNKDGEIADSVLKEVRGRTNDSKFGRPPVAAVPFEIVQQKPVQNHHISCCLYSGDTVRVTLYHDRQPLANTPIRVVTSTGWSATFHPAEDGVIPFEIPRHTYVDTTKRKRHKEHLLISAEYVVETEGDYHGHPYRRIRYTTSESIDFGPSPLEWAAKTPAFQLALAAIFALGFGVFLYRLWIRRRSARR